MDVFHNMCFSGSAGPYTSFMDSPQCLLCFHICIYVHNVLSLEDTTFFTSEALLSHTPAVPLMACISIFFFLLAYNRTIILETVRDPLNLACVFPVYMILDDAKSHFN